MSVKALSWAFAQQVEDATAKLILIALADFSNEEGKSWPSRKKLASYAECSLDTIDRKIEHLVKKGVVKVKPRTAERGDQTSNLYQLVKKEVVPQPQFAATPLPQVAATPAAQLCGHHGEPPSDTSNEVVGKKGKTQEAVEAFAMKAGFPKSDGTAMFWHFESQGWGRDWKATFQKWRWNNYLPSQKASRGAAPRNVIPITPAVVRSASEVYGP